MTDLWIHPEIDVVPRNAYVAEGPIPFETWISLAQDLDTELINGVMVDRLAVEIPHELLYGWLVSLLYMYVGKRSQGIVLGSRTAVKVSEFDGRLPDILFVRQDNTAIIRQDAIYGAPDLVVEIVSSDDRLTDLIPLETAYRTLGVREIVFIDPKRERVRVVHKIDHGYEDAVIRSGRLPFRTIPGFWIEVEWLFDDERPSGLDIAMKLLNGRASER